MKTQLYTYCMKSKYGRISNTNINFFYSVLKKLTISLFLSIPPDGTISSVTYALGLKANQTGNNKQYQCRCKSLLYFIVKFDNFEEFIQWPFPLNSKNQNDDGIQHVDKVYIDSSRIVQNCIYSFPLYKIKLGSKSGHVQQNIGFLGC